MPAAPIRCSCPHCAGRLGINPKFVGKKIKCPKCQQPFVVEPPEDEVVEVAEAPRKIARKPAPAASDENGHVQDEAPRKKRRVVDEDDEYEDRAPRPKRKRKKSNVLPWVLVGSGAAVLIAVAIVLIVVLKKDKDSGPVADNGDKKTDTGDKRRDNRDKKGDKNEKKDDPNLLADLNGPWLEPGGSPGADAVVMHILVTGYSFKSAGAGGADREKAIREIGDAEGRVREKLLVMAGSGVGHVGATDDAPSGTARLMSMHMRPMKESAEAFAKKIDFGTVRSVANGVITLVVRKDQVPGAAAAPDGKPIVEPMPLPLRPKPIQLPMGMQ
jgi:hypothetical protein